MKFFVQVPQWIKVLFFIHSQKLVKERSNSTLLNLTTSVTINDFKNTNGGSHSSALKHSKDYAHSSYTNNILSNQHDYFNSLNYCKKEVVDTRPLAKREIQMQKLLKLIKQNYTKLEEERQKLKNIQEILVEWRELARKLDCVFLVISCIIIIISPIILFGRLFIRDIRRGIGQCGCE